MLCNENEMLKNTWYDWLISYITEPIMKFVGGVKDQIMRLFRVIVNQGL